MTKEKDCNEVLRIAYVIIPVALPNSISNPTFNGSFGSKVASIPAGNRIDCPSLNKPNTPLLHLFTTARSCPYPCGYDNFFYRKYFSKELLFYGFEFKMLPPYRSFKHQTSFDLGKNGYSILVGDIH